MGVILSTVGGYHDAREGYHEYRGGCSVPWGEICGYLSTPTVLKITSHGIHDIHPRY